MDESGSHTYAANGGQWPARLVIHYLAAFAILLVYGGQVCPFVEGLSLAAWAGTLATFLAVPLFVHPVVVDAYVAAAPWAARSRRQFMVDAGAFAAAGAAVGIYNLVDYGFPLSSGLKVLVGFGVVGLFVGMDMALLRERLSAAEIDERGIDLVGEGRVFPLTRRFVFSTTCVIAAMLAVIFLVIVKDMDWIVSLSRGEILAGRLAVLGELAFVGAVVGGYLVNLIVSYARNLDMYFLRQNAALEGVASGRAEMRVPVSTSDEFGVMARYTNVMIEELARRAREIETTQDVTILTLASVAEIRDTETGRHILRTQRYVRALAEHLRGHPRFSAALDPRTVELLFKSAPLHDIGKVGVRDAVLRKPGPLTAEEFDEMKMHPAYGYNALTSAQALLGTTSFLRLASEIALTHHEKWDGSGYPGGLAGDAIPVSGRLMALADVYDALVFTRVYRKALSHETARGIILDGRGSHFDPEVADAFLAREDEFMAIAREFAESR